MKFPEPVISFDFRPNSRQDAKKLKEHLKRMSGDDPTFRSAWLDDNLVTISGMGEIHLDILRDAIKRAGINGNSSEYSIRYIRAGDITLEPVMKLRVRTPERYLERIRKDLAARQAHSFKTGKDRTWVFIECLVPMAQILGYATDGRSLCGSALEFVLEPNGFSPTSNEGES